MTLLAIDTATRSCSVGLLEGGRLLAEESRGDGQTHSRHLMTMIDSVLQGCGLAVSDLSALAVTVGPGSFTGLRIGLATAKGIAAAAGVPMAGVGTLEALCLQADGEASLICALIDARKEEVYGAFFRAGPGGTPTPAGRIFVCTPERALDEIDEPCMFIGDGALLYREQIRSRLGRLAWLAPDPDHRIRAATVGRIGRRMLDSGGGLDPGLVLPVYIRKADAERKLGKRDGFH